MKKLISILLSVVMLLGLMSVNVFADEPIKVRLLNYHDKDGNLIAEKYIDFDVAPTIINGRTMVPIRAVAEELGYYVSYDKDTGAVSLVGAFEQGKYNQGECIYYLDWALNACDIDMESDAPGLDKLPNFCIDVAMGSWDENHNCNNCNHNMLSLVFPTRVITDADKEKFSEKTSWWLDTYYLTPEQTGLSIEVSFLDNIKVMDALTPDCAAYSYDELGSCEVIYDYSADVLPVIIDGRTLLPLRAIAESMGLGVSWDGTTNTVTLDAKTPYFDNTKEYYKEDGIFNLEIENHTDLTDLSFDITVEGPNGSATKNIADYKLDDSGIYQIPFEIGKYSNGDKLKVYVPETDYTISLQNGKLKIVEEDGKDYIYYTIIARYEWDTESDKLELKPIFYGDLEHISVWYIKDNSVEE